MRNWFTRNQQRIAIEQSINIHLFPIENYIGNKKMNERGTKSLPQENRKKCLIYTFVNFISPRLVHHPFIVNFTIQNYIYFFLCAVPSSHPPNLPYIYIRYSFLDFRIFFHSFFNFNFIHPIIVLRPASSLPAYRQQEQQRIKHHITFGTLLYSHDEESFSTQCHRCRCVWGGSARELMLWMLSNG